MSSVAWLDGITMLAYAAEVPLTGLTLDKQPVPALWAANCELQVGPPAAVNTVELQELKPLSKPPFWISLPLATPM